MLLSEISPKLSSNREEVRSWLDDNFCNAAFECTSAGIEYYGPLQIRNSMFTDGVLLFKFARTDNLTCYGSTVHSLAGFPSTVDGDFKLYSSSSLETLDGCPSLIAGNLLIGSSKITSLKGAPSRVLNHCKIEFDNIESLEHMPRIIGKSCYIWTQKNFSLEGINEYVEVIGGALTLPWHRITSGGIGLLLIRGITEFNGTGADNPHNAPFVIIEKYLGRPDDIFECQTELIAAGYATYAVL